MPLGASKASVRMRRCMISAITDDLMPLPALSTTSSRRSPPRVVALRPNQQDTDMLPDYALLDPLLERYVEGDKGIESLKGLGLSAREIQRITRLVDSNEYKRRQAPPGVKITPKAFGRDRRLPITNRYKC